MRNWIFLILFVFQSLVIYSQQSLSLLESTSQRDYETTRLRDYESTSQQVNESVSASKSESESKSLSLSYIKSYWHSGLTVIGQPLHYDWKDWTVFVGVAATTTLAFVYDDEIFNYIDKTFTNSQSSTISQYTDILGEELFIVPSIALTYGIGAIAKDTRLKNMSLATLQSLIFAEVASAGIKVLTCRERPDANSQQPTANSQQSTANSQQPTANSQIWLGPFATFESTSFVSGHATRAFALATTVAGFYPEKKWLGVVSYSLATATTIGRVVSKEHWTSDVIVGAALGYFIGRGVVKFNEKIGNINSVRIEPIATNYGVGIAVRF